jgi:hypothetical protein
MPFEVPGEVCLVAESDRGGHLHGPGAPEQFPACGVDPAADDIRVRAHAELPGEAADQMRNAGQTVVQSGEGCPQPDVRDVAAVHRGTGQRRGQEVGAQVKLTLAEPGRAGSRAPVVDSPGRQDGDSAAGTPSRRCGRERPR